MTHQKVHISGKPISLGQRIGKGGEGEVYQLSGDPVTVVKIYFKPDQDRFEKINAVIQRSLATRTKLVAFPIQIATDPKGNFLGFTMSRIVGSKPLHELYSPKARKQNFPQADYRFLVRTAKNTAAAVAAVHEAGCVIGDINHSSFLISDKALVSIIDADSFQISGNGTNYLCRVGVPEYTPPELQGQSLDGIIRTVNHDSFGLAVVIFQFLLMGRHPFAGRYSGTDEMPLERAIAEGRYAYSTKRQTGISPPPNVANPSIMPREVIQAFEEAFTADASRKRPSAQDWFSIIDRVEKCLVRCPTHKEHYFPQQAGSCPWCAMDNRIGTILFPPIYVTTSVSPAQAANFNLDQVWAAIEAVAIPDPKNAVPQLPTTNVGVSAAGREAVFSQNGTRVLGLMLLAAGGAVTWFVPALWFAGIGLAGVGINRLLATPEAYTRIQRALDSASIAVKQELINFHRNSGILEPARIKEQLERDRDVYRELPKLQAKWHDEYQHDRRKRQLNDYLDGFRVDKSKIQSINWGVAQTLIAYGYETAADVDHRIDKVPGIGEVRKKRLLDWKRQHEARFVFSQNPTLADQAERQKIDQRIAQMRTDLQNRLISGAAALRDAIPRAENAKRNPHHALVSAYHHYQVCVEDAKAIGHHAQPLDLAPSSSLNAPVARSSTSYATSPVKTSPTSAPAQNSCPICGSPMVARIAHRGSYAGKPFWGCTRYPACKGIRNIP